MNRIVYTVGHSTRSAQEFVGLLAAHGVQRLIDVRTLPGSRHNPQFNRDALAHTLREAGIEYLHLPGLGGLRKPRADSPNQGWRNRSFRGYADHMQSAEFLRDLQTVMDSAERSRVALMCAEAVPWRCHRSLIADALLVRGIECEELVAVDRRQSHRLTPFAVVTGEAIIYPPAGEEEGSDSPSASG
jgi:uncharacterized protein (DUF488 family)